MYQTAEEIARTLGGARKAGDDWSCRCPAHDDKKASLSIKDSDKGRLLVHCHAGCAQDDVINELKILGYWPSTTQKPKVDLPPVQISIGQGKGVIKATYDYTDEHGELLYQAVRYEPKDFRQRRPLPDGNWSWSIKGVRRVLYRLQEVIDAVAKGEPVLICEGEKDVENARALGLTATCNAMGADNGSGNKWLPEFADYFVGADVIVIPDQDVSGTRHADWVVKTLEGKARNVGVANPKAGKDLSDWIEAGAGIDDIFEATTDAFEVGHEIKTPKTALLRIGDLIRDIKPIQWLVKNYFEEDSIALIYGAPSSGKSFFSIDIAASIATGQAWFNNKVTEGVVVYIAGEGLNGLSRRFRAWEIDRGIDLSKVDLFRTAGAVQMLDEEEAIGLSEQIYQVSEATGKPIKMVIIDTLARNYGAGDENSTEDMNKFIQHTDKHVRQRFNCCVGIVHHSGHNAERARGSSALKAAVDAEFEVTKDEDGNVKIRGTKMKEAEVPEEMMLKIRSVEIPELIDEDGNVGTSAVLDMCHDLIMSSVAKRSDGTKITAKEALEKIQRGWLSFNGLMDALNCSKRQAENTIRGLERFGFVDIKGKCLTQSAHDALSRTGHNILEKDEPFYARGKK